MKSEWTAEHELLKRWAISCARNNSSELMRLCGLTWAGSPPAIMAPIYDRGAEKGAYVPGYAKEYNVADEYLSEEVERFMTTIKPILPHIHDALMARYRRILHGEQILIHTETWIAQAIYGKTSSGAWKRLEADCCFGYGCLRRFLTAKLPTSNFENTSVSSGLG